MSYVNAPATKMLATHCACCGRALVDAKSVEAGIGPDCRERFGVDVDVTEAAREEANQIVFLLARKGLSREDARPMFDRLAALGFVVLADRVAKRFRASVTKGPTTEELRAEYAKIRASFCYDNCSPAEFNELVIGATGKISKGGDPRPEDFVEIAKAMTCRCKRCGGTGRFITYVENGEAKGPGGECFRCGGKGRQDHADVIRNRAFDKYNAGRVRGAAMTVRGTRAA